MSGEYDHAHQWHRVSTEMWVCAVLKCTAARQELFEANPIQAKRVVAMKK